MLDEEESALDADEELRGEFWRQVVLFNVALLGVSLGAMLVGFDGRWLFGAGVFAVGAVAFLRGYARYRTVTRNG